MSKIATTKKHAKKSAHIASGDPMLRLVGPILERVATALSELHNELPEGDLHTTQVMLAAVLDVAHAQRLVAKVSRVGAP